MKRTTLVSSALGALLATTLLSPSPAQAAAPTPPTGDRRIEVVQHNTDETGPSAAINRASAAGGVDAITFQELCADKVPVLEAAGYNVTYVEQVAFSSTYGCGKGLAIATPHTLGTVTPTLLQQHVPSDGRNDTRMRSFWLLCANLQGTGVSGTSVCTTHMPLDYNGDAVAPSGLDNRIAAADQIKSVLAQMIAQNKRVVFTGDLNDDPESAPLTRFYAHNGGTGSFFEGDQTRNCATVCRNMEPTTDSARKLDYFFASRAGVDRITGLTKDLSDATSGHHVVFGTVRFGTL